MLAIIKYFSLTNTAVLAEEEREEKELAPKTRFQKDVKGRFLGTGKGFRKKKNLNYSKNNIQNKLLQIMVISTIPHILQKSNSIVNFQIAYCEKKKRCNW